MKEFSARAFANNFSIRQIPSIIDYLHNLNKKLYIALNTIIKEEELTTLCNYLETLSKIGIDALIVQDFGILNIVNEYFPELKIHASTQMNNLNSFDIKFLANNNVRRLVLDRQLTFEEIKKISEKSNIEIELFIHGALCYSFSGQCIFSSFLGGQSANRGRCTQPCRRGYVLNEQTIGYYFSPNDLSTVKNIEKLLSLKITSFKIEGRMKNYQYVGNITKAYRMLIDEYNKNKKISNEFKKEVNTLIKNSLGRKTCSGFYFNSDTQIVEPKLKGATGLFIGKALETSSKHITIKLNIGIEVGDRLRIQELRESIKVKQILHKGKYVDFAQKNSSIKIPLTKNLKVKKGNTIFKISAKDENFKVDYSVLKNKTVKISDFKKIEEILPNKEQGGKKETYFKIKTYSDINVFPNNTKDFLIVPLTSIENLYKVRKKLSILVDNLIFELPMFLFENEIEKTGQMIDSLIKNGFKKFYIHSKGSLNFFSNNIQEVFLIASERFHIANSLSADFIKKQNIVRWVLDIENDRANLINFKLKKNSILTVYANYPLLVSRIPTKIKNNSYVTDNKKNKFFIKIRKNLVYIFDKRNFNILNYKKELEQHGYTKFLFDISNVKYYKSGLTKFYNNIKSDKIYSGSDFNYSMGWE